MELPPEKYSYKVIFIRNLSNRIALFTIIM